MKDQEIQKEIADLLKQCHVWYLKSRINPEGRVILAQVMKRLKSLEVIQAEQESNSLSKREQEILEHVANGFSNREIASALEISEKTIEYHLKSVFKKVDASTRTEAVSNALKRGWL